MGLQQSSGLNGILSAAARAWLFAAVCLLALPAASGGEAGTPYRVLKKAGSGFPGPGREAPEPSGTGPVRLGVIGPSAGAAAQELRRGVALAVAEANERGGYNGRPYEVVFRPDDGPWGMGAKQVAALAYEDSVWAVIGSLSGAQAHLAELVSAKLWVPVITPAAPDRSIDYANVPWVFRVFPSDADQARLLARYAADGGYRTLSIWAEDGRDGRTGLAELKAAAADAGLRSVDRTFGAPATWPSRWHVDLTDDAIPVVWAGPDEGLAALEALRNAGYDGPVLLAAQAVSRALLDEADRLQPLVTASPFRFDRPGGAFARFAVRYADACGAAPGPVAAFSYDTACLTIAAVQEAGLNRARIRDALARTDYAGVVGRHTFNGLGGGEMMPVLLAGQAGAWAPVAAR